MKVCYILRDRKQGGKSIEEIFKRIISFHTDSFNIQPQLYHYDSKQSLWSNLKRLRAIKADVYHNTGAIHFLNIFLWGKPTILTVHDLGHFHYTLKGLKKWIYGIYNVYLPLLLSKKISVISKFTRRQLINTTPFVKAKTVVIHNPYPELFQKSPKRETGGCLKILQIGTGRNKNVKRLIEALRGKECHLTIVGPLSSELSGFLHASKIRYSSFENLAYEEIYQLYCQADLVTFPSTFEGFGMPIIEANAVGRPIVTSNIEPMLEIADDAAIFIDPYDVADMREAIESLERDSELYKKLVENGYKNIERFEIAGIAEKYYELYQTVVNEKS